MMNTAKSSNRNEFSSIHARIDDILGGNLGQNPASTQVSRKANRLSRKQAAKSERNYTTTPRAWNESFAFAIDG